jgi:adenine phosphoribosyltransferase
MDFRPYILTIQDHPEPGITFRDITHLLEEHPKVFQDIIDDLAEEWRGKIDGIVALEARGFPFGGALSYKLGVPFIPARKKGKLPRECVEIDYSLEYGTPQILQIHKSAIKPGKYYLVLDDLLATGGTAGAACKLVVMCGGEVAGCAVLIELSEKGLNGRAKLEPHPVYAMIQYSEEDA